ncbi:MAG: HypC/HybG/HupF family hydrogenase formation chaperone [Sulfurimonadaceae bacterium]|jgi:hydrogenase expression/formation protein HypC|nr:HypC/HybG/HupF family hydrogenase formation chaperone [Sulfurimonadaceae bacterium]
MCLSIPSKIVSIDKETNTATVDTMGVSRDASLNLIEEGGVSVGDYVLIHIGFVMQKIDEKEALESLRVYEEVLQMLDDDALHRTVLEDDNCQNRGL